MSLSGLTRSIAYIDFSAFFAFASVTEECPAGVRCSGDLHTTVPPSTNDAPSRSILLDRIDLLHMATILRMLMNDERDDGGDMAVASQFVQIDW